MEGSGVHSKTQFPYRKGLGTCDVLLCVSGTMQRALESVQEVKIMQVDYSTAFELVNHQGILYKHWSVGIGGAVLSVLTVSINRSLHVMMDGCQSNLVDRALFRSRYFS